MESDILFDDTRQYKEVDKQYTFEQALISKKDIHNSFSVEREYINSKEFHDKFKKTTRQQRSARKSISRNR